MAMRGLFFSIDAILGISIALVIIAASTFTMLRFDEDKVPTIYLSNLAGDVLASMDKNETLDTLDSAKIDSILNKILPDNLGYVLDVKVFQCSGSGCSSFSEVTSKSFKLISDPSSEKNAVINKRTFLTFDNSNRMQYISNAELRVWLR